MKKIFTLLFISSCFLRTFCQAPQEGDELNFKTKEDGRQYVLKVIENRPLENNPMVHFHAQPLIINLAVGAQTAVQAGAGVDVYLLKSLQVNADLKVSILDVYGPGNIYHTNRQVDGSVGVSYGFAFNGHGTEKVYLGYGSRGYQSVRYYAKAEEVTRGFHVGGRAGYSVYSGYFLYQNGTYSNVVTNNLYLGIYMTRIRDFFVRNEGKLNGRFAAQKVYADVLLPFYTAGSVYPAVSDTITVKTKPTGFYPGFRIGLGIFPPAIRVRPNGNLQKVAFYSNFELGMRPGAPVTQTFPFYASIGFGISYMTFKPHFNGDNVKKEPKKKAAPSAPGH